MGAMTRVAFFTALNEETLAALINQLAERIEHQGEAIKHVAYQYDSSGTGWLWTAMVVYGNGPKMTQRWAGQTS